MLIILVLNLIVIFYVLYYIIPDINNTEENIDELSDYDYIDILNKLIEDNSDNVKDNTESLNIIKDVLIEVEDTNITTTNEEDNVEENEMEEVIEKTENKTFRNIIITIFSIFFIVILLFIIYKNKNKIKNKINYLQEHYKKEKENFKFKENLNLNLMKKEVKNFYTNKIKK